MSLADLDRKSVTWHYDRWDEDVVFRPISAKTFAALHGDFGALHGQDLDAPGVLEFYAAVLSATVVSHPATPEEWQEASQATLMALGYQALKVNNLLVEDAKKNSPIPSTDLPSPSAES